MKFISNYFNQKLTLYQVHSCFLKLFRINILLSHSNDSSCFPLELIDQFLYETKIGFKLIKIQLCEAKIFVMRVGSRAPATFNMNLCGNYQKMKGVKNSHKELHLWCCSGSRSRLNRLIINLRFMRQLKCNSKMSQTYYSNTSDKKSETIMNR